MQRIRTAILWAIMTIAVAALGGCGGATNEPRAALDDPRTYAIEALQTIDLNTWWQTYRNPDPALLGRIVDEVAASRPDGLPADAQQLDMLIRNRIATSYKLAMADTDEGRAYILALAEARFADPPMAAWDTAGNIALLDYYSLPGAWKSVTRVSEGLADPPAIETQPFLKPEVLADSLQRLAAAYPDARTYQIRYQYHHGSDLKKVLMQVVPDGELVYREGGDSYFTADPVSWDDLLRGRVDLADLDWDSPSEDDSGPSISLPPDQPLPSRQ